MGDRFGTLLASLMGLRLTLVDQNPSQPCLIDELKYETLKAIREYIRQGVCLITCTLQYQNNFPLHNKELLFYLLWSSTDQSHYSIYQIHIYVILNIDNNIIYIYR